MIDTYCSGEPPITLFIDDGHGIGASLFEGIVKLVCDFITEETFEGALELADAIGIDQQFIEDNFHELAINETATVNNGFIVRVVVRCGRGII